MVFYIFPLYTRVIAYQLQEGAGQQAFSRSRGLGRPSKKLREVEVFEEHINAVGAGRLRQLAKLAAISVKSEIY